MGQNSGGERRWRSNPVPTLRTWLFRSVMSAACETRPVILCSDRLSVVAKKQMLFSGCLMMYRTEEVTVLYGSFCGGHCQPVRVQRKVTHGGDKGHLGREKPEVLWELSLPAFGGRGGTSRQSKQTTFVLGETRASEWTWKGFSAIRRKLANC